MACRNSLIFLVWRDWEGYDSWEPVKNIEQSLIDDYEQRQLEAEEEEDQAALMEAEVQEIEAEEAVDATVADEVELNEEEIAVG